MRRAAVAALVLCAAALAACDEDSSGGLGSPSEVDVEVGPGIMPSYAALSKKKKDDLTAFLASLD